MKIKLPALMILSCCLFPISVPAQDPQAMPEPTKEHQWLKQFQGEWTTQQKGDLGPGQPPMACSGTITSRMVGGFWVVNEMKGDIMGVPMTGLQTIGYDVSKKKYVGTWVDSMTSFIWHYEGNVDETGKILTLEADGPNFMAEGKLTKFRDIYEFKPTGEIAIYSKMLGEDGKWVTFMTGVAKKKK